MRNIRSTAGRAIAAATMVLALGACTPREVVGVIFGEHADEAWVVVAGDGTLPCRTGESGGNPEARSPGGGNHGLFQINNVHRSSFEQVTGRPWETGRYEADANTAFAKWLFDRQGWGPWTCKP